MLVDVHAHIDRYSEEELKEVIERAKKENVKAIITQGVNHENNLRVLEEQYQKIFYKDLTPSIPDKHNLLLPKPLHLHGK